MAVLRDQPYGDSNFLVDLGTGETQGPLAGFDRVVLPVLTTEVVEYRNGNDQGAARKLPARAHFGNAILERGVVGSLDLYQWWRAAEQAEPSAFRDVVITLLDEQKRPVLAWRLRRAFPVRLEYGPLSAQGSAALVERLELACEQVEIE